MQITEELLKSHPRPKQGQLLIWDDLVVGFGVRFTPTVTAFVVQWRDSAGKKPRETLKRWPACSVRDARNQARARLSTAVASRESGADVPLRIAMRAWYERKALLGSWRPRYQSKIDSIVSAYIEGTGNTRVKLTPATVRAIDVLGRKSVSQVTRTDVIAVADGLKPGAAEQFLAIVSSAFSDFYEREWVTGNPARNRLRITGGRRVRHRTPNTDELQRIWRAVLPEGDPAAGAFALLLFTGCRRREITQLRWEEIDLDAATLTLPAARRKTGKIDPEPFVITLHAGALEILRRQPVIDGNPNVFWGRRDEKPFEFNQAMTDRIRARAKVVDWRLHDLRRFVRSGMARLGVSQAVAELCLGHCAKPGLVKVYDSHQYIEEKSAAWLRWGDQVAALLVQTSA